MYLATTQMRTTTSDAATYRARVRRAAASSTTHAARCPGCWAPTKITPSDISTTRTRAANTPGVTLSAHRGFSRSLSPGNIVAAGMTEKEFKKREPPFRYDLAIVLESAFKAAKQLSSKADGATCQIAKGHWAVKLAWLDRIAKETEDNADGDDGDDDHKHTFIVEDTPTIVTGVEGLIRVKGIQVTIDGGDACATVPLPHASTNVW